MGLEFEGPSLIGTVGVYFVGIAMISAIKCIAGANVEV